MCSGQSLAVGLLKTICEMRLSRIMPSCTGAILIVFMVDVNSTGGRSKVRPASAQLPPSGVFNVLMRFSVQLSQAPAHDSPAFVSLILGVHHWVTFLI